MNIYEKKRNPNTKMPVATKHEAVEVLSEFFYTFHPVEAQEGLRKLMNNAFEKKQAMTETEKEDMIYFCKKIEELIEAAYLLKE